MKEYSEAKPADRQALIPQTQEKLNKIPRGEIAQKALDLAKKLDIKDPGNFDALMYALSMANPKNPELAKEALSLVVANHSENPKIVTAFSMIVTRPDGAKTLENIAKNAKDKAVSGQAWLAIAENLKTSATRPGLDDKKVAEINKKSEAIYENLEKEYADVKTPRRILTVRGVGYVFARQQD